MKTKTISNFGIIFAVALTMVTAIVFTACNSEDDFGGDLNGDITGQYSLATRMMTRAGENNEDSTEDEIILQTISENVSETFMFNSGGSSWSKYMTFTITAKEAINMKTGKIRTYASISDESSDIVTLVCMSCFFSNGKAHVKVKAISDNPYYSMSGSAGDETASCEKYFTIE